MKPSMSQILIGAAASLDEDVAPALAQSPNAKARVGSIGLILACAAQEADRAVETAVLEQDALRALFRDASKRPVKADLQTRLATAGADTSRPSLKLSDLQARNEDLLALLGELLEFIEPIDEEWAAALEERVWRLLKAGAERRSLFLPVL